MMSQNLSVANNLCDVGDSSFSNTEIHRIIKARTINVMMSKTIYSNTILPINLWVNLCSALPLFESFPYMFSLNSADSVTQNIIF